ncbi:MAG: PEP-CTERM sorting domain-containing protein [Planctomycetota bacterium]
MLAHRELGTVRRGSRVFLPVVAAAITMLVATSAMAYVSGYNAFLEQSGGRAFIPQKPQTSGELGEVKGNRVVGARADMITLRKGDVRQGWLTYDLLFDLSENFDPGSGPIEIDPANVITDTMELQLDLTDLDFVPVTGAGRTYSESLGLKMFSADKTLELTDPGLDFLIDAINYGNYRADGFGPTNNVEAQYAINLVNDLGLAPNDFARIFQDMGFTLEVTLTSTTMRTAPGRASYRSTREYLGDYSADPDEGLGADDPLPPGLDFEIVPEPMTLSLLGLGAIGLLRQRRR